jgi:1-acyl-sn-glycerol-3-phosphate acyltransferase
MYRFVSTVWSWLAIAALCVVWYPLLLVIRFFDKDPVHYRTGRWFRNLGVAMTKVNPLWKIQLLGERIENPRNPYVVVSNHQSMADIPIISHVPWEMKWVGKDSLFTIPWIGWMMSLSDDIAVDRSDRRSGVKALLAAERFLKGKCSVIFFPEGTRSPDGRVRKFNDGAFHLAIRAGVPVLPLVIEGSGNCLPKHSWMFGEAGNIRLAVLPPVPTTGMTRHTRRSCSEKSEG